MQKKSLETILYSAAGVVIMAAILIGLNVITAPVHERIDLTKEKAYTLSAGTKAILAKLDTPVKVRFYCTQAENANTYSVYMKSYAKKVEDLLTEYKQAGHGKLVIEKYDPQPDSDAEQSARLDGLEPQNMPDGEPFYLGLAVSQLDAKEAIPFLSPDRERELEYDISRAISRVVTPEKPVIGIMSSLPVFGEEPNPMMQQMGQQQQPQPEWALITELKSDFTVKRVEMSASKIDDSIKLMLVIHPKDISDAAQYAIDQFVMRGGKLIAFLDTSSLLDSRNQNPMMGQMPSGGSSLDKLIKAWGLQFDTGKVVADRNFSMNLSQQEGDTSQLRPVWLSMTTEGINSNDIATAELESIMYFAGGAFTGTPAPGLTETVLLHSTTDSQLVDGMLANFPGEKILQDFKPSGTAYALAVRLSGKFKTAFPEGNPEAKKDEAKDNQKKPDVSLKETTGDNTVVLVGDADMIYDGFSIRRVNSPFGVITSAINGNLSFAQNLVEQLSGDNNLIAVRSRAVLAHPFTRLRKLQAEADARLMDKAKEYQDSRDKTVARLRELQQQKSPNQRYIESPEQKAEIESLNKTEAKINGDLKSVQKELRKDVNSLQHKAEVINIAAMPLLVIFTGVGLAVFKRKRNSAK
jgi:ABC-type uncharacterized transport system involved in gliding motility auxiliary subunit